MSTQDATVGTTKRAEMFSPASSGSVQSLTRVSRAELACTVAMPGQPAVEREQQVEALLGPDLADDEPRRPHPQRFLDQMPQGDLAGALEPCLAGLHRHPVRVHELQLVDLLARDDAVAARAPTSRGR